MSPLPGRHLCDRIWHVSSRSDRAGCKRLYKVTLLTTITPPSLLLRLLLYLTSNMMVWSLECLFTGMHHQGVFRIPGPQNEVNEFRNEFESGMYDSLQLIFCSLQRFAFESSA